MVPDRSLSRSAHLRTCSSRRRRTTKEYQFKDSSYSDKGIAVYHGLDLPLYSIAAVFAFAGIIPDRQDGGPLAVRHGVSELTGARGAAHPGDRLRRAVPGMRLRSRPRSVRSRHSVGAVVAAALASPFVSFGSQARYYSATLALTALCGWAIWRYLDTPDGVMQGGPDSPWLSFPHALAELPDPLGPACRVRAFNAAFEARSPEALLDRDDSVLGLVS